MSKGENTYLILGRDNLNRAVHGDIVAIQVLPESDWRGTSDTILDQDDLMNENAEDESEETDQVELLERKILESKSRRLQMTAKVVGIVKRNWRTYHSQRAF